MYEHLTFTQYLHLRQLAEFSHDFGDFLREVGYDPERYRVEGWSKADYGHLYERIKGGHEYDKPRYN